MNKMLQLTMSDVLFCLTNSQKTRYSFYYRGLKKKPSRIFTFQKLVSVHFGDLCLRLQLIYCRLFIDQLFLLLIISTPFCICLLTLTQTQTNSLTGNLFMRRELLTSHLKHRAAYEEN